MTPATVDRLIEHRYDALSAELQRAARWVRQHRAQVGLQSMRSAARQAGVSPATMTRLAQALGMPGYETLRVPYRDALASAAGASHYLARAQAQQRRPVAPAGELQAAQQAAVASVAARNDAQRFHAAAQLLLRAKRVLVLGLRASHGIAWQLHYTCNLLLRQVVLADDAGGMLADQIAQLGTADVLVAVSQAPYTRRTVEAVLQARERQVNVLALTDSALSPIARPAQQVLLFDAASPSFFQTMTGAQAAAETLVAALVARGGAAVLERLREMQAHLQATRAYWERPVKAA